MADAEVISLQIISCMHILFELDQNSGKVKDSWFKDVAFEAAGNSVQESGDKSDMHVKKSSKDKACFQSRNDYKY